MREGIDLYNIGTEPEALRDAILRLRQDFDAHQHDGSSSKSFETLSAETVSARTMLIRKTSFTDTASGLWAGLVGNTMKFVVGNATAFLKWTGSALQIAGDITGSTINIPDSTTPLFSVDASGNVVAQSLRRKDFEWFTLFESLDGYQNNSTGTGTMSVDRNGANFSTGATSASPAWITKGPTGAGASLAWTKKRRIKFILSMGNINEGNSAYIATGSVNAATDNHFGFFVTTTGTLKGSNADGTTERQTDLATTLVAGTKYTLEAVFDGSGSILYYVNGVLKATVTLNLPSGTDFPFVILDAYTINSTAANKTMIIYSYDFWQEG